jgi:hypothetical protein
LFVDSSPDHFVELREGARGYCSSGSSHNDALHDLKNLQEVNGNLEWVCSSILGDNPRLVVETKKKNDCYRATFHWGDREALDRIAVYLNLAVAVEEREIDAITIREVPAGHRLKPFDGRWKETVESAMCVTTRYDDEGHWNLNGFTVDELARLLETRFRRPVTNLTSIEGQWSITLEDKLTRVGPSQSEVRPLGDLGLELRWEKVRIPVTVVKDRPLSK